ncbi:hypothetical protein [Sulfurimonas sp.]|uniref:hypothetical protein n=1 Tax=Sulfurimonas sp. TaxID=2022749 RepID=UPI001A08E798|nr:hypothetical protein [Sulfurimonas sp.]MBE0515668.1 hypothetical protein [Sulfurimonas sp.]
MRVNLKKKRKNFTIVSNILARDAKISLKAKGISLVIAHFSDDWNFYEEFLQEFCTDKRTAIANAIKELEVAGYLYRTQSRKRGRFSKNLWIFGDEGLSKEDISELCTDCGKTDNGFSDVRKSTTINTHSYNTKEYNKKNTQKKGPKRKFYHFVNVLKQNAEQYPNLQIEFENKKYCFQNVNGQLLLKDKESDIILSKVAAERLYQKMANSLEVKVIRGENA